MTSPRRNSRYFAFLSYSNRDRSWGEWLQTSLEGYAVPADLQGRTTDNGPVPTTLKYVFRDRWDLSAGHSLNQAIESALQEARHLVVICSPSSAKSTYVNEEIHRFRELGKGRNIFPVIVDGEPGDPRQECFPEALTHERLPDGRLVPLASPPIAADARAFGDDKDLAKLKIIAGMLGVPLDEIRKREEIAQRQRIRQARLLAGAMAALALLAIGGAVVAWWQYDQANKARALAEMRQLEAEQRYEQALDATLRFVTTSATFRTLLGEKIERIEAFQNLVEDKPIEKSDVEAILSPNRISKVKFNVAQIEGKGASSEFQDFLRQKDSDAIWMQLVDVLIAYERHLPWELQWYERDIRAAKIPLQWIKHAETIALDLSVRHPGDDTYMKKLAEVRAEVVRQGGTIAPDCTSTAASSADANTTPAAGANPQDMVEETRQMLRQTALNLPCK